jgi:hypothetical protein
LSVFGVLRVLAAVEFDNQAPLAANKIGIVSFNGRLADEFEAAELPATQVPPQHKFCRRERVPHRPRKRDALLILARNTSILLLERLAPHPGPLPASGAREATLC